MNPLLTMATLSFVFSHLAKFDMPNYPLFLLSGILAWNLYNQSLAIGVNSIIANGALLKKLRVPAYLFPLVSITSVFVHFLLALIPFLILAVLVFKHDINFAFFLTPMYLLIFLLFIYGCTLLVSSLNVRYRDVSHTLDPILQLVFYATPIVYPVEVIPQKYSLFLKLNPLVYFIDLIRTVLFKQEIPSIELTVTCSAIAIVFFLLGAGTYKLLRDDFVYDL